MKNVILAVALCICSASAWAQATQTLTSAEKASLYEKAVALESNPGGSPEFARAIAQHEELDAMGYAPSTYRLARIRERGPVKQRDLNEALRLYTKAASAEHAVAQIRLARWYYDKNAPDNGYSPFRGIMWLKKAAARGHPFAEYLLGDAYEKGYGVQRDIPEALRLFKSAGRRGEALAAYRAGVIYLNGVSKDKIEDYRLTRQEVVGMAGLVALPWFEIAAQQGLREAQWYVDRIEDDRRETEKWREAWREEQQAQREGRKYYSDKEKAELVALAALGFLLLGQAAPDNNQNYDWRQDDDWDNLMDWSGDMMGIK